MNQVLTGWLALGAWLFVLMPAIGGEPASGTVYQQLRHYDFGGDAAAITAIDQQVREATTPEQRRVIEDELIAVLKADDATFAAKQFACRMLRVVGSARCVPALGKLLIDEELSHSARFALAGIPGADVSRALRHALLQTKGKVQIGIMNTLADRRDQAAITDLAGLLASGEPATVTAALRAIGRIGNPAAAKALKSADVANDFRDAWYHACLTCAERLRQAGQGDAAGAIYHDLFRDDRPMAVRAAAVRGIALVKQEKALPILLSILKSNERELLEAVSAAVMDTPGTAAGTALAQKLTQLPVNGKIVALTALAGRTDIRGVSPIVNQLVADPDPQVQLAAVRSVVRLGDATSVAVVANTLKTDGPLARAAMETLVDLRGERVVDELLKATSNDEPQVRAGVLDVLAKRGEVRALAAAYRAANDDSPKVRQMACKVLGALAGQADLPRLVELLLARKDAADRDGLAQALATAASRIDDRDARSGPVIDGLAKADASGKAKLMGVLARLGGAKALAAVRPQLTSTDEGLKKAAVQALADWPDASPLADLVKLAKGQGQDILRIIALRGYIRLAGLPPNRPAKERLQCYRQALDIAFRPEEKRAALAELGKIADPQALALAEEYIEDDALKNEALVAYEAIAELLIDSSPGVARKALDRVKAASKDKRLRKRAQQAINKLDKYEGCVNAWMVCGPYEDSGKDGPSLFDLPFAPEKADAKDLKWKPAASTETGQVHLDRLLGGSNRVAYLRSFIEVADQRPASLEIGSDDGVKVWLNGEVVHGTNTNRAFAFAQDQAPIELKAGRNELLVKVTQTTASWSVCVRVCKRDGGKMTGLTFKAE